MSLQTSYAVTFDIDWAPDWCIEICAEACREFRTPATFFATHRTDILSDLASDPLFEVGIHPNFLNGSSHGETTTEVLDYCLALVPGARAMRSHGLHMSSPILAVVAEKYRMIGTDVSLLLPLHRNLTPTCMWLGYPPNRLIRLPYIWEDALFGDWPDWDWRVLPKLGLGMSIFNFHPIWVALNLADGRSYRNVKSAVGNVPLFQATRLTMGQEQRPIAGAETFLRQFLAQFGQRCRKISEISQEYQRSEL